MVARALTGYGAGGFKLDGEFVAGSLLLFDAFSAPWHVAQPSDITLESLAGLLEHSGIELLLVGCGQHSVPLPPPLHQAIRSRGMALELMDTGAACRTYNVLQQEARKVALAAIAV
jgi:uncharacterized protein